MQEVKEKVQSLEPYISRCNCFALVPAVKLRCITADLYPEIKKGEIVTAISIDDNGIYPNTVHLQERGYWWPVRHFEIVNE